jgi:CBS domain-containing protein
MQTNRPISGVIDVSQLTSLERDLLKDALGVVKRFKALMRSRFRLDTL